MAAAGDRARRPSYGDLEAALVERDARIAEQDAVIAVLKDHVGEFERQIAELKRRLGQNSCNSSKPSSSDGYGKPSPKKRGLRRCSGRKPGGQEGHEGANLERVEVPDRVIVHEPEGCCEGCGRDLGDAEDLGDGESRQVFDIPEKLALGVIEHLAKERRCDACGRVASGRFPDDVKAPAQYGANLRAFADLRLRTRTDLNGNAVRLGAAGRCGPHRLRWAAAQADRWLAGGALRRDGDADRDSPGVGALRFHAGADALQRSRQARSSGDGGCGCAAWLPRHSGARQLLALPPLHGRRPRSLRRAPPPRADRSRGSRPGSGRRAWAACCWTQTRRSLGPERRA